MEATINQSVTERNITLVALANIQPSNFNPRKHFDETSLNELAGSIRQQGVLQAIGVRPITDTDRYEIVFGERRYRASLMAGLEEIPAVILEISDEAAEEMAVTENLQRKDVTPIEEGNAYQKLIESGRHNVETLAVLFGKNESYIRTRLKFTALLPEIATLLETEEMSISIASEICCYSEDIQREIYEKHLKEDVIYNSWRGLKAADVAKRIEQNFTTNLRHYQFDKTLCASCPYNTNNLSLFHDGSCGNCANRTCLEEMNTSFLVEKALQIMEQQPTVSLCRNTYNCNEAAVERLIASGYEVETLSIRLDEYPDEPEAPNAKDYDNSEDYIEDYKDYEQEQADYKEECTEISRRSEAGEISFYAKIGQNDITLCYVDNATVQNINGTTVETSLSPMEKLEVQDKRNKEIALEKTVEDTKKQILKANITESKFDADEEKMIYFFLLSALRKEHFAAVGLLEEHSPYLLNEEKMSIIANLTAKTKAIIRRDFLIANFKDAFGSNAIATLLLDFARKHMPEELVNIENRYNEVYVKRHQRIEEKKAVLSAQEKTKEEASQSETPQPEEQPQSEEKAA